MADYVVVDKEKLENDLTIVADSIRAKSGTSEALEFPSGYKSAVESIESGGGSGIDYAKYATSIAFGDDLPNVVKLNIPSVTSLNSAFKSSSNLEELEITSQDLTNMTRMIYGSVYKNLKKITMNIDYSKVTLFINAFNQLTHTDLEAKGDVEIIGDIDFSSATNVSNMFAGSSGLKEVRFVANTLKLSIVLDRSSDLSNDSIQSIIDGLATVETTQTLTFHKDVKSKLTETQLTTITSKNWTLA